MREKRRGGRFFYYALWEKGQIIMSTIKLIFWDYNNQSGFFSSSAQTHTKAESEVVSPVNLTACRHCVEAVTRAGCYCLKRATFFLKVHDGEKNLIPHIFFCHGWPWSSSVRVPLESGTSPKCNQLFLDRLSTFPSPFLLWGNGANYTTSPHAENNNC